MFQGDKELLEIVRKLEPILGSDVRELWYSYLNAVLPSLKDRRARDILLLGELVLGLYDEPVLLRPPEQEFHEGKIELGKILYGHEETGNFTLDKEALVRHVGIFGTTGSGKTNLLYLLIEQLQRNGIPFQFFDVKQNFRHLLEKTEFEEKIKVSILGTDIGNFKDNHLAFPEHPILPRKLWALMWANFVIKLLERSYLLGHGVNHVLRTGISKAYEGFGIFNGVRKFPTWHDVEIATRGVFVRRGRKLLWMDTKDRLVGEGGSLVFEGGLGNISNTRERFPIETFLKENHILELDYLVEEDRTFQVDMLLLRIYIDALINNRRGKLRNIVGFPEAHNILRKESENLNTFPELMFKQLREMGTGLVYETQNASELPMSVLQNTNTVISFRQNVHREISTMQGTLLLDFEDSDFLGRLKVGEGIVKTSDSENAFHVRFPLLRIEKKIDDKFLEDKFQTFVPNPPLGKGFEYLKFQRRRGYKPWIMTRKR
ncbi:MAG: ATP-binding protein [Candidatus Aenigmarchaeota archaeon]|nr:ATP-binding protein [Candidatus Aenigmarchaeota archaeon]